MEKNFMNIEKMLTAEMPDSMVGKVVTSFDTQVSDPDVNVASYGLTKQLNDNLSGFKFYPIGTNLVALVADDSFYTDANDKYVLADSATGQALIDGVTYKALASTEDCRGEAGADTAIPFSEELQGADKLMNGITSLTITLSKKYKVFQVYAHPNAGFSADRLIFQINSENISPILKVSNCFTVFYEASV
jgi:hypothetical protein